MVGLNNGTVEFRFDLGSGEGSVSSKEPLITGQSYNLSIQRYHRSSKLTVNYNCVNTIYRTDNTGRIKVSGQDDVSGTSPGAARSLNIFSYNFQLYLGKL